MSASGASPLPDRRGSPLAILIMGVSAAAGLALWHFGQPWGRAVPAIILALAGIFLFGFSAYFWGGDARNRHEKAGARTMIAALIGVLVVTVVFLSGVNAWLAAHVWDKIANFRGIYALLAICYGVFLFGMIDFVWGIRNRSSKASAMPMMVIVMIVFIGGTFWTVMSSFTDIKTLPIFTPREFIDHWVGLDQYRRLWGTARWIVSIRNLAIYGSLYTIFAFVIGFGLAVLMDQKIRLEGVFRTIYLYPFALSLIVTGHVWAWIMNPAFGLEATVRGLGWASFSFDWLTNREMSIYAVVIAGLWQGTGLVMALMLAGLRGIDDEIWRAARVDGIPTWRTYIQIVLPMMRPVLVTTFVIVASGAVRVFDLVVSLTQGGPGTSSQVPSIYVYERLFVGALAQGTAASTVMLLTTAIILIPWIMVEFGKKSRQD